MAEEQNGEKTEEPTPKRREKAREDGSLAQSKDVGGVTIMAGVVLVLTVHGGSIFATVADIFRHTLGDVARMDTADPYAAVWQTVNELTMAYLGAFALEEKGPGVELTLPFGVDNRVEVVRVPLPRSAGREGLTGKQRVIQYGFRTQLHNLQDRDVTVVLEDRLPVSEDERVEVRLGKETTPGFSDSERRPGVMLWTLELAASEKREIVLAYSVRFPRDLYVPGLD